jgi:hypothetical protein
MKVVISKAEISIAILSVLTPVKIIGTVLNKATRKTNLVNIAQVDAEIAKYDSTNFASVYTKEWRKKQAKKSNMIFSITDTATDVEFEIKPDILLLTHDAVSAIATKVAPVIVPIVTMIESHGVVEELEHWVERFDRIWYTPEQYADILAKREERKTQMQAWDREIAEK